MTEKSPFWNEAETAFNVVFGAALGGYLGVVFAGADSSEISYFKLYTSLILIGLYVLALISSGRRFSSGKIKIGFLYLFWAILVLILGQKVWQQLPVNLTIINSILAAWLTIHLFEFLTDIPSIMAKKKND